MRISNVGLNLIKEFEGLRLKPYKCSAGVPTIGFGSTYYEDGTKVSMSDPAITEERAKELFLHTLKTYMAAVDKVCDADTTQNQYDAMVSLCYNIGTGNFSKSSVAKFHKAKNYGNAANSFGMWRKAGGQVVKGLVRRREAEKNVYLTPTNEYTVEVNEGDWLIDWPLDIQESYHK